MGDLNWKNIMDIWVVFILAVTFNRWSRKNPSWSNPLMRYFQWHLQFQLVVVESCSTFHPSKCFIMIPTWFMFLASSSAKLRGNSCPSCVGNGRVSTGSRFPWRLHGKIHAAILSLVKKTWKRCGWEGTCLTPWQLRNPHDLGDDGNPACKSFLKALRYKTIVEKLYYIDIRLTSYTTLTNIYTYIYIYIYSYVYYIFLNPRWEEWYNNYAWWWFLNPQKHYWYR